MFNSIIRYFIYNPIFAFVLALLLTIWGVMVAPFDWDIPFIPRDPIAVDAIPNLGENQQIIFTKWEGRSPKDVEDQITYPLTTALMGMPKVKTIRSNSMFGFSSIYVIFEDNAEFYWTRSRILEKLSSLPNGLLPDGVSPSLGPDATALGQIFWYTLEGRNKEGKTTGGWDLHELRSIQDFTVKPLLNSASGVSEVASIGGHVMEYQIDIDPDMLKRYSFSLKDVLNAVRQSNQEIGAKTIELNQAEYIVRGLGYISSLSDIESIAITTKNFTPVFLKDLAKISIGPSERRGILDKEGAEVVGGVVISRYDANPMEVISNVKKKIKEISKGLPSKTLNNGEVSNLTIVPFYDRTQLIKETLETLNETLILEVAITILVILVMLYNLRASFVVTSILPLSVLMVFITMKWFSVDANIVALSGIAIAIGTVVDMGIILIENILRHLRLKQKEKPIKEVVYQSVSEVSGAIITAVLTTIVSFVPVFTLTGTEGKLFHPLAFTKTMALTGSIVVALFILPTLASIVWKERKTAGWVRIAQNSLLILFGFIALYKGVYLGLVLFIFPIVRWIKSRHLIDKSWAERLVFSGIILSIVSFLSSYWMPLGGGSYWVSNFLLISVLVFSVLYGFHQFQKNYSRILGWTLRNKGLFLCLPFSLLIIGSLIWRTIGKEFMPSLNEGSFLLMPSSMSHAGVEENKRVLQLLDLAVASIPEVETIVGKAGRIESAIDPAPLSMYENIISYLPEYKVDEIGKRLKFKVNNEGLFELKSGQTTSDKQKVEASELILDPSGRVFRNWRSHIKSPDDIWKEIVQMTQLPGVTSASKLQPIETRLLMLQTGMRSPIGIKIMGNSLESIEKFGLQLEPILREVEGVNPQSVFAERMIGKPYLILDIDRQKITRYGLSIKEVQDYIEIAMGGKTATQTVEGRERYKIRIRYARDYRSSIDDIEKIEVKLPNQGFIPLSDLVHIRYEKGPQAIKSENTFLTSYVLFDKKIGESEVDIVNRAQAKIAEKISNQELKKPKGINYYFAGTYESQIRAEKTLLLVIPIVLLIIFFILYLQFQSVVVAFMVFSGIAVAFSGGFILIGLYGQSWFMNFDWIGLPIRELFQIKTVYLSVAVWVGFIALFGIATDDGVVMATYLTQNFKNKVPKTAAEIRDLVIQAGKRRVRPCLMTTATTILALFAILTSHGRGSDIMIPMAIPVFGGMLLSLITLFIVPVLFSLWKEKTILKPSRS